MLRKWQFFTLLLMTLDLGMSFAHALELTPKLRYDGGLYVTLQNSLYVGFGTLGAVIDVVTPVTLIVLAVLVRGRRERGGAFIAAFCFIAAFAIWAALIAPVNSAFMASAPENPPANWESLRSQWEYAHAARFVLQLVGYIALAWSALVRAPESAA